MGTEGNIELYNVISKETKVVALLQDLNKVNININIISII